jgi:cytochrome c-type biogenesis protein
MSLIAEMVQSFSLGLATPLTAVCVIPLYPGFLAFLANQNEDAPSIGVLGALVGLGVILFMAVLGLIFTTILESSPTALVGTVSPLAFGLLALLGTVLLLDLHPQSRIPTIEPPQTDHPMLSALAYGAFFGAIVLPCNPGFMAVFFSRAFLFTDPINSMANFWAFGLGMAAPLMAGAAASEPHRDRVLRFLTGNQRAINALTGAILLAISVYYLFSVFEVHRQLL